MNDWKIDMIIRLLEIIKQYESATTATSANGSNSSDDERLADEVARLNNKIFGDPYPPKN